ncbi:predicted helicase [Pseudozyma hubeiensis SY62]|uniref:Predicted helicase n=1 Tax=Pseudozyma hubeiensis (strain SY62) TaxID=1305764 RepID=R9NZD8_PSEHS|nr:predicted helicase [Pseudozyma hubeiensis SY62]GAC94134.1 predicted helicase [Pseudozyma hubeiensis SY62]
MHSRKGEGAQQHRHPDSKSKVSRATLKLHATFDACAQGLRRVHVGCDFAGGIAIHASSSHIPALTPYDGLGAAPRTALFPIPDVDQT